MAKRFQRGTPIYIAHKGRRIALVPEVGLSRRRFVRTSRSLHVIGLEPAALYLIDKAGVKRVSLGSPTVRQLRLITLAFLAAPLLSMLVRWRKRNG